MSMPRNDRGNFDGNRRASFDAAFKPSGELQYLAFNKPFRVLSQFSQPEDSEKETLAEFGFPGSVYPLGRLDYDSEGLLLLSDDRDMTNALLDPAYQHKRTYWVQVEHVPTEQQLKQLAAGVMIESARTLPAEVRILPEPPELAPRVPPIRERKAIPTAWIELGLKEGRNRQVRKMTAAVGCPTLRLIRAAIGNLKLSRLDLAPGQWRKLSLDEVALVFRK